MVCQGSHNCFPVRGFPLLAQACSSPSFFAELLKPTVSLQASPSTPLLPPTRSPTSTTRVNSLAGKTPFPPTSLLPPSRARAPPQLPLRSRRNRKPPPADRVVTLRPPPLLLTPADEATSSGKKRRKTTTETTSTSTGLTDSTGGLMTISETAQERGRAKRRIRLRTMCHCRRSGKGTAGRTASLAT